MNFRETRQRRFSAWMLLAVFVPMLLLSSFHVHEQASLAGASCTACVDHHCGGHLDQQTLHLHDCVLCQFVSLPYLWAIATGITLFYRKTTAYNEMGTQLCPIAIVGINASRAPPSF